MANFSKNLTFFIDIVFLLCYNNMQLIKFYSNILNKEGITQ